MKESFKSILFPVLLAGFFSACSDDGSSAPEEPVDTFNASVVCPADGVNGYGEPNRGTFTDARDGQVYKYTTIGDQVWMAENLKFNAPYSLCYDKIEDFCETFGRFYTLHENGEDLGHFDQELLDTICPAGWRVPSVDDWIPVNATNSAIFRNISSMMLRSLWTGSVFRLTGKRVIPICLRYCGKAGC